VKLLLAASSEPDVPISILIAPRSEFLGDAEQFWGLPEAIGDNLLLVSRMTREEMREAIEGPVAVAGAEISRVLVHRLLNDAAGHHDQLGLLQHALRRTWDKWNSSGSVATPDLADLEAVGGFTGALEQALESILANLSPESVETSRKIFQRLVEHDASGRHFRRPTRLSELADVAGVPRDAVIGIIDRFHHLAGYVLVDAGENPIIDISHEAIIRHWPRLQAWVEEERKSAEEYLRLTTTAERQAAGLARYYREPELSLALQWRSSFHPTQAWAQRYHPQFERATRFQDESCELIRQERKAACAGSIRSGRSGPLLVSTGSHYAHVLFAVDTQPQRTLIRMI
jgi:hypothetical protein